MLKPWHLTLSGITLTIAAALMQHLSLEEKFAQVEQIETRLLNLDSRIDSLWQRYLEAERKKEFAALIAHFSGHPEHPSQVLIRGYLASINTVAETKNNEGVQQQSSAGNAATTSVNDVISQHQARLLEHIDSLYLERLQQAKAQQPIQREISTTGNIALLLQLLGLILVLSKDWAKAN